MNAQEVIEKVKRQESIVNSLEQDEKCIILMALEKQIPKIPVNHDNCGNKCASLRCPSCFEPVGGKYCENCGQRLDLGG